MPPVRQNGDYAAAAVIAEEMAGMFSGAGDRLNDALKQTAARISCRRVRWKCALSVHISETETEYAFRTAGRSFQRPVTIS